MIKLPGVLEIQDKPLEISFQIFVSNWKQLANACLMSCPQILARFALRSDGPHAKRPVQR